MSDPEPPSIENPPELELARERTKQVATAGWTGGFSALFAAAALTSQPTWPVAVGVAAFVGMVAIVCHAILKRP